MQALADPIADSIATVWSSMLGVDVQRVALEPKPLTRAASSLVGCVHMSGTDRLALALDCSESLARLAASVMFDIGIGSATVLDARDALAELTNITGGNVKALLPDGHQLSLPTVVERRDFRTTISGARPVVELAFDCGGNSLTATLFLENPSRR